MLRLDGKSAIITGAGRGIGKAIAHKFLTEGARVVIGDVVEDRLQTALEDLQSVGEVHALPGDVTDPDYCAELVRYAQDKLGDLHILANNAGIALAEPFLEHSLTLWDRTLDVNLRSMFVLSQQVARVMVAGDSGGAIVNMASSNAHLGEEGLAAYNASKAGVLLLTKTMAIELAAHNIRVNCVSPGFIFTDLSVEAGFEEGFIDDYTAKIPLGRFGKPEEVANVFAFLASDEASFMTGESVVVDGGQLSQE